MSKGRPRRRRTGCKTTVPRCPGIGSEASFFSESPSRYTSLRRANDNIIVRKSWERRSCCCDGIEEAVGVGRSCGVHMHNWPVISISAQTQLSVIGSDHYTTIQRQLVRKLKLVPNTSIIRGCTLIGGAARSVSPCNHRLIDLAWACDVGPKHACGDGYQRTSG